MGARRFDLTLGPVLFNWSLADWEGFYARMADEAELDRVVVGETVCSKRLPFYADRIPAVIERLSRAGKSVTLASLGLVTTTRERQLAADLASIDGVEIEVNDLTQLAHLSDGAGFAVGPLVNVYNEKTMDWLAGRGARRICLPPELPLVSIDLLARAGAAHGVAAEVWAFGRVPLAISGRCYHARIHGLTKDSCQFVCAADSDGLSVETVDGQGFLAVNGVQTLSHGCATVLGELDALAAAGVASLRLSPHRCDMVAVVAQYRACAEGRIDGPEATARLRDLGTPGPLSNGFLFGAPGASYIERTT